MSTFWNDVRYAVRVARREPGFTIAALLTLMLGIGANTAIFSVVNGIVLRPLAYKDPQRLYSVREVVPEMSKLYPSLPVNARHFLEWRKQCSSFEGLAIARSSTVNLTGDGEPEQLEAAQVSANMFQLLGVEPRLGRGFLPDEDQRGRERVVILTDALWKRRFNSDPAISGKAIQLDGIPYVVAGVLPPSFRPKRALFDYGLAPTKAKTDIFRPLVLSDEDKNELMGNFNFAVLGRLKNGASDRQAMAELNVVENDMVRLSGEKLQLRAALIPLRDSVVGQSRRGLVILMLAALSVLLIVCVNLANLLLARAERRHRESAVRTALGASQGRLVRQMLAETLLLALVGGAMGAALAFGGVHLLVRNAPLDLPRLDEVRVDAAALAFALAVSTVTGLLFGILPAWRMSRADPQEALKAGGRSATHGLRGTRLRSLLVSVEVGLSAVLLITAGLLMGSFFRLVKTDKGFRTPSALAADIVLPQTKYRDREQTSAFWQRAVDRLASEPGVVSAAVVNRLPMQGETWVDPVAAVGDTRPMWQKPMVNVRFISPDYFETLGIPLLRGRKLSENDRSNKVGILSQRLAATLWPHEDPIGKKFTRGNETVLEVIGVVGDVRAEAHKSPAPIVYYPYWDRGRPSATLVARAAGDPRAIAGTLRAAVWSVDRDVPVADVRSMEQVIDESVAQRRFQTMLSGAFAAAALLLACLGIYGVVSYSVARRANEMGIRMALGARPAAVHGMVLRQGMMPVAAGLAAGVAAALAVARVLQSLLFEISPRDPATIAAVSLLLGAVGAIACYVPARRATRVDPMRALRYE